MHNHSYRIYFVSDCQCLTKKGTRCKLLASTKKGEDPKYCSRWHQSCSKNTVKETKPSKKMIGKKSPEQEFVFFWKPNEENGYLGQWFEAEFKEERDGDEYTFPSAEHYMMWRKALLFGDDEIAEKIYKTKSPKSVKALGRKVGNFDEETWMENNFDIVVQGNLLKFQQNPDLLDQLLQTGDKILVEASPYDRLWGIGLKADNPLAIDMKKWKGKNLLGKALMEVRKKLS